MATNLLANNVFHCLCDNRVYVNDTLFDNNSTVLVQHIGYRFILISILAVFSQFKLLAEFS